MSISASSRSDGPSRVILVDAEASALASSFKTVAVLGIKPESRAGEAAHFVAKYLHDAGIKVVPVPTFYPDVTTILGQPVYRTVVEAARQAGPLDCVDVFRRPTDVPQHIDDVIAAGPRCVWLQSGIRCPEAEEAWLRAGITVVADKCLKVMHRQSKL